MKINLRSVFLYSWQWHVIQQQYTQNALLYFNRQTVTRTLRHITLCVHFLCFFLIDFCTSDLIDIYVYLKFREEQERRVVVPLAGCICNVQSSRDIYSRGQVLHNHYLLSLLLCSYRAYWIINVYYEPTYAQISSANLY